MKRFRKKIRLHDTTEHPLKQFRTDFGMNQVQLAIFLKKSRSYISLLESGARVMPTAVIMKIENYKQEVRDSMQSDIGTTLNKAGHLNPRNEKLAIKLNGRLSAIKIIEIKLQDLIDNTSNKNMLALNAHERLASIPSDSALPEHEMIFKQSRIKTTDWVRDIAARDIELRIKQELLQAEARIIRKYLAVLEPECKPNID